MQGHEDSIHAAALSPDEALLATASYDCTARLWSMKTGQRQLVPQHGPVPLVLAILTAGVAHLLSTWHQQHLAGVSYASSTGDPIQHLCSSFVATKAKASACRACTAC